MTGVCCSLPQLRRHTLTATDHCSGYRAYPARCLPYAFHWRLWDNPDGPGCGASVALLQPKPRAVASSGHKSDGHGNHGRWQENQLKGQAALGVRGSLKHELFKESTKRYRIGRRGGNSHVNWSYADASRIIMIDRSFVHKVPKREKSTVKVKRWYWTSVLVIEHV